MRQIFLVLMFTGLTMVIARASAQDPFAPPPKKSAAEQPPADDPFAPPVKKPVEDDPFAPPKKAAADDPFAPPAKQPADDDPFAPPSKKPPSDDPFAPPKKPAADDPFAPLAKKPSPDDPFSPPPKKTPGEDPFAPPAKQPAEESAAEGETEVDIAAAMAALAGDDAAAAVSALRTLIDVGPAAAAAVPALTQSLSHADAEHRRLAALALGSIGPAAKDAVPALAAALDDESDEVRAYSAYALGRVGKPSLPAAEKLVTMAFDEDALVRRASIRALRAIEPPDEVIDPILDRILESGDTSIILPALHTLAEDGAVAVPRLRKKLKHEEAAYWACLVLAEIGPEAKDAVPEITEVLEHKDPDARLQALLALGEIGNASKTAIPEILDRLANDPFEDVRNAAAYALGKIGEKNYDVNNGLVAAAKAAKANDQAFLRMMSLWAIAKLNPHRDDVVELAVKEIIAGLTSKDDPFLRSAAARALSDFGNHPTITPPLMIAALQDADRTVVANAIAALAKHGEPMLDRIAQALEEPKLRGYALSVLQRMGPRAAPAVPAMVAQLTKDPGDNEEERQFQMSVVYTLAEIGPGAKAAVPALTEQLTSEINHVRNAACFVLGKIGPDAAEAADNIRALLDHETEESQLVATVALLRILPNDDAFKTQAVPTLIEGLDHEFELARAEVATALGNIGPAASAAVEPLKALLNDPAPMVRGAAQQAIAKIQGSEPEN